MCEFKNTLTLQDECIVSCTVNYLIIMTFLMLILIQSLKGKVFYGQEPPSEESTIPQNVGSTINYLQ